MPTIYNQFAIQSDSSGSTSSTNDIILHLQLKALPRTHGFDRFVPDPIRVSIKFQFLALKCKDFQIGGGWKIGSYPEFQVFFLIGWTRRSGRYCNLLQWSELGAYHSFGESLGNGNYMHHQKWYPND